MNHDTHADEPPDAFDWMGDPQDPDAAAMPAEFIDDSDGVPGVRREPQAPAEDGPDARLTPARPPDRR
jgi:hypothetical protein